MRPIFFIFLIVQAVLLGLEQFTNYDTVGRQNALTITNLIAIFGVWITDWWLRRRGQKLSAITIVIIAAAVWLDALGNFQHFYGHYWWYDRLTHAVGGMAVAALFTDWLLIRQQAGKLIASRTVAIWYGFFIGQFVASMYEVSEWLGDWWFGTARVRSAFDTPRDLFFNLVGGLVIAAVFLLRRAKK